EQCALVVVGKDLSSDRDLDDKVLAACAGSVRTRSTLAARRAEMLGVAKVDQCIEPPHRLEDDIAALASVAAVRPAELDEFLSPETDRSGAPGARADKDLGLVEKVHRLRLGDAGGERKLGCSARRAVEPADRADDRSNIFFVRRPAGDEH